MSDNQKIVYFDKYCLTCQHFLKEEYEEPCDDCLNYPTNTDSHKPVRWKERVKE